MRNNNVSFDNLEDKRKRLFYSLHYNEKNHTSLLSITLPLLKALNWDGSQKELMDALSHGEANLSLSSFLKSFERLGYTNKRISARKLLTQPFKIGLICIDNKYYIWTPKNKKEILKLKSEFKINPQTKAFTFHLNVENQKTESTSGFWVDLKETHGKTILLILALSAAIHFCFLCLPFYIMLVFDNIIPSQSVSMFMGFSFGVLLLLCGGFLLQSIRQKALHQLSEYINSTFGHKVMAKILRLPFGHTQGLSFEKQLFQIKQFENVRQFFYQQSTLIIFDLPFAVLGLLLIGLIAPLGLVIPIIMTGIFCFSLTLFIRKKIIRIQKNSNTLIQKYACFETETLYKLDSIQKMSLSLNWFKRFLNDYPKVATVQNQLSWWQFILNTSLSSLGLICGLSILSLGSYWAIDNQLSSGALIASLILYWKGIEPLKQTFLLFPKLGQIQQGLKQFTALMAISTDLTIEQKSLEKIKKANLSAQKVGFRYYQQPTPTLLDITFSIKSGEKLSVVGPNGSGKSTLLKLLSGLYSPQAGHILINGQNSTQFSPMTRAKLSGYVGQTHKFIYGTLAQNLLLAKPHASKKEVFVLCERLGLMSSINDLPLGLDTPMGDQCFSGNRLHFSSMFAIAQLCLQNPSVMLIDETLDSLSDEQLECVLKFLFEQAPKKTLIWVTHRPSLMEKSDKVLYLEDGRQQLFGPRQLVLPRLEEHRL